MADASQPFTLPVHCAHCQGAVTLQMAGWRAAEAVEQPTRIALSVWTCPYCAKMNEGLLPGRLAWATKREDDSPPVV